MSKRFRDSLPAVALLAVASGGFVLWLVPFDSAAGTKGDTAGQQILQLEGACQNYMAKHGGDPPASLEALVVPFDGGLPLVEGGPDALIDPWGKPYRYDPSHVNRYGDPDPLVWTTDPDGEPIYSPRRKADR